MAKSTKAEHDPTPVPRKWSGGAARKSTSKSSKAGLTFPVPRINRRMYECHKITKRIGAGAPIYLTAIVEYFAAELLELSINQMRADGKGRSRITPLDVVQALRGDADLHKATNGLRVMIGDVQKDACDMVICKTDWEHKVSTKMEETEWFDLDRQQDTAANWKRYKKEKAERDKAEAKKKAAKSGE